MNCYENTFIARQDLSESQNKKIVEKYENIINKNSGKIIKTEEWGLRNLSHLIKNNKKGYYFHLKFEGNGATVQELEKNGRGPLPHYFKLPENGSPPQSLSFNEK